MYIPLITDVFAFILKAIMTYITPNFGLAIIIFTIVTKALLFPLQLKSKKGMIDQQRVAPKMAALEKKYGSNKQKYSEEVQKLYKQEGVSMLGGCLPTLLVLVVILGLYGPIYRPVSYMMNQKENVTAISQKVVEIYDAGTYNDVSGNGEVWVSKLRDQLAKGQINELNLAQALTGNTDALSADFPGLFSVDLMFLGLDLGEQPSYNPFNLLAILPVLSALAAFGMSWLTQKINDKYMPKTEAMQKSQSTTKTMLYLMPIMSLVIGFTLPSGLTLYWIVNSVLSGAQEPLLMRVAIKRYGKDMPMPAKKKSVVSTGEVKDAPADAQASQTDTNERGE